MKVNKKCYRIITDTFCGYEVQERKSLFFLSWWKQSKCYGNINTFSTMELAKRWIEKGCPKDKLKPNIVWVSEKCKK